MGHRVDLVERRPFLGGRAARIGTVFPHQRLRPVPADHRRAGRHAQVLPPQPGDRQREPAHLAAHHGGVGLRRARRLRRRASAACPTWSPTPASTAAPARPSARNAERGRRRARPSTSEFYDGRVVRTVDLETCSFCGACTEECPVGRHRLHAVARAREREGGRHPHSRGL